LAAFLVNGGQAVGKRLMRDTRTQECFSVFAVELNAGDWGH